MGYTTDFSGRFKLDFSGDEHLSDIETLKACNELNTIINEI